MLSGMRTLTDQQMARRRKVNAVAFAVLGVPLLVVLAVVAVDAVTSGGPSAGAATSTGRGWPVWALSGAVVVGGSVVLYLALLPTAWASRWFTWTPQFGWTAREGVCVALALLTPIVVVLAVVDAVTWWAVAWTPLTSAVWGMLSPRLGRVRGEVRVDVRPAPPSG